MDLGLKGKSVLVLASSKGLGFASAKQFLAEGASVMITSHNEENLKKAYEQLQQNQTGKISMCGCDVTKAKDIKRAVQETVDQFGSVDVLVNNAGGPPGGRFDDFTDQDWHEAFELNLLSYIRAIREVLPHMRKRRAGRIVNIASSSFKQPIDGLILSNTFRTGVMGLAKSLSQELAKDQILINTIGPGRILTERISQLDELHASKQGKTKEEMKQINESLIPIGRSGTPEEFARVIAFIGSFANTYVTGQSFVVDGGLVKAF